MNIDIKYKKIAGIYEIICLDKRYIGSSKDLYGRITVHISSLKRNKHHSIYMQRCFNKYGINSFNINILEVIDYEENKLRELELNYIDLYNPVFNSTTPITYNHSQEMKNRISKTLTLGYKSGKIPHPRFNKGKKYNIYNAVGDLVKENITISYVVDFFKLASRAPINIYIRKSNGVYINSSKDFICIQEGKCFLDVIHFIKNRKNINNLHIYKIENDIITRVYNKNRFTNKILNSENLIYYSKKTKCHYTFIGLFKNAVLDSNI